MKKLFAPMFCVFCTLFVCVTLIQRAVNVYEDAGLVSK